MAEGGEALTKRDFLRMAADLLQELVAPQVLRSALEVVASKAGISDVSNVVGQFTAVKAPAPKQRVKADNSGKEKTRKNTAYSVFMTWFLDFAAHYGRHPTIVTLRSEHPGQFGLKLVSNFYRKLTSEQKAALKTALEPFLDEHEKGIENLKKYEAEHPDVSIGTILGLEAKPEYKTDPAQVKAEAAEARRQAGEHQTATRPEAGDDGMEVDHEAAHPQPDGQADAQADGQPDKKRQREGGPTPASKTPGAKKPKKDPEAAVAPPAAEAQAANPDEGPKEKKKDKKEGPEHKEKKEKGSEHKEKKDKGSEHKEKKDKEEKGSERKDKKEKKEKKDKGDKLDEDHKSKKKDKEEKSAKKSDVKSSKKDKEKHKET